MTSHRLGTARQLDHKLFSLRVYSLFLDLTILTPLIHSRLGYFISVSINEHESNKTVFEQDRRNTWKNAGTYQLYFWLKGEVSVASFYDFLTFGMITEHMILEWKDVFMHSR